MALGNELIINGNFEGTWATDGFSQIPDGWALPVGNTATKYVEESAAGNQLKYISDSSNGNYLWQTNLLTEGTSYRLTFDVISISAEGGALYVKVTDGGGNTYEQVNTSGSKSFDIVGKAEGSINFTNAGSPIEYAIDNVSVKEILPTTTVEVEWIDSVSAAATGNKIYRDTVPPTGEVEIADIANGVQIYQDATAETGTEYKYEVQAHDGLGGETTLETVGVNTQFITTA